MATDLSFGDILNSVPVAAAPQPAAIPASEDPFASILESVPAAPVAAPAPPAPRNRMGVMQADNAARRSAAMESTHDLRPGSADTQKDPLFWRTGTNLATGLGASVAAVPEQAAILLQQNERAQKKGLTQQLPMVDMDVARIRQHLADPALDAQSRSELEAQLKEMLQGRADLVAAAASPTKAAKDTDLYKAGRKVRAAVEDFAGSVAPEDMTFWDEIAQGAGMLGGAMATTVSATMVGGPGAGFAALAGQGAAMNGAQLYEEALASGADEETAIAASKAGSVIGLATAIPLVRAFQFLPANMRGAVTNAFLKKTLEIGADLGVGAATNYGQQVANNLVAENYFDPKRGWSTDTVKAAVLGLILGAGAHAAGAVTSKPQPAGSVAKADVNVGAIPADATAALAPEPTPVAPAATAEAIPADVQAAVAPKSNADITREALAGMNKPAPKTAPPVTSEGNPTVPEAPPPEVATAASAPEAAGDTIAPVPESPATIAEQTKALLDPKNPRKAVYLPYGSDDPAPAGRNIKAIALDGGMLYFDSRAIGVKSIQLLAKNGQLGKVLGLGDITKADAAKSMAEGNAPVAVTERTPDGTEVKAAAGTTETAPEQIASLEASKTPGNEVAVEPAEQVLQDRATARVEEPVMPPPPEEPVAPSVQDKIAELKARKRAELDAAKAAKAEEAEARKVLPPILPSEGAASEGRSIDPNTLSPEEKARIEALIGKPAQKPVVQPAEPKVAPTVEKVEPPLAKKAKAVSKAKSARKPAAWKPGDDAKIESRKETIAKANKGEFGSVAEEAKARGNADTHDRARETGRVENAVKSDKLMRDTVPDQPEVVRNLAGTQKVFERLWKTIEEAKKRKIGTVARIEDSHTNAQAWLAQVRTMASKLRTLADQNAKTQKEIIGELVSFLADEQLLVKTGDASSLRASRLEAGEQLSKPKPTAESGRFEADSYGGEEPHVDPESAISKTEEEAAAEGIPVEYSAENDETPSLGHEDDDVRMFEPTQLKGDEPIPRPVAKEGEVFKAEDAAPQIVPKKVETIKSRKVTPPGKLTADQIRAKLDAVIKARENGNDPLAPRHKLSEEQIEEIIAKSYNPDLWGADEANMTDAEIEAHNAEIAKIIREQADEIRGEMDDQLALGSETSRQAYDANAPELDQSKSGREFLDQITPDEEILAEDRGQVTTVGELFAEVSGEAKGDPTAWTLWQESARHGLLQKKLFAPMMKLILRLTKDVPVFVLHPDDYARVGGGSLGYYSPNGHYIVLRAETVPSVEPPGRATAHYANTADLNAHASTLLHEAVHAAFMHAIEGSSFAAFKVRAKLSRMTAMARLYAAKTGFKVGADGRSYAYGLTDIHEFVSEGWANPQFVEFLNNMKLTEAQLRRLDMWDGGLRPTTMFQALKRLVSDHLGFTALFKRAVPQRNSISLFDQLMDVSSDLFEMAPEARKAFYDDFAERTKSSGEILLPQKSDKLTPEQELVVRGLTRSQAKDAAAVIKELLGDKATPAHLDAIAEAFQRPISEGVDFGGEGVPPQVTEAMSAPDEPGAAPNKHATLLRKMRLGMMTADHMVRVFAKHFEDGGVALKAWQNAVYRAGPIAKKIADVHDEDAAAWMDLRAKNPKAAAAAATLVTDLSPFDLDIRPGAANKHLSKNGKGDYQAKKQLPALKAAFAALPEEVQALLSRMSDHYRETHNKLASEVTKVIMEGVKTPLTTVQKADILERTLKGTLDDADRVLIGDDAIFETLDTAREVRTRNGMFFPAQRFGDWVVTTKRKVALPDFKDVITKQSGTKVPVKVEQDGNKVRLIIDSNARGSHPALLRAAKEYVENHELAMTSYRLKYKDRATGKIVNSNERDISHDYDLVHEIAFQDDGVHFFDKNSDARDFHDKAQADLKSGVISELSFVGERHEHGQLGKVMNATAMDAVIRALDHRLKAKDISKVQHDQMVTVLRDAVIMNMPGNRYEKRLLKRRDILGQSEDLGRAANAYGRAAGNYMGSIKTGPARRQALEDLMKQGHDGIPSQVLNEVNRREATIGGPEKNTQLLNDIVTISSWKRLFSPAGWTINASQPWTSTHPVLAGRYGTLKADKAIISAYNRMGALGMVGEGLKNTGKAVTLAGNHVLDTSNTVQSARKNLGEKYEALIDRMLDEGDLSDDVGIENVGSMVTRQSAAGKAIAKVDRITRQMPAAIEAVNRIVSAVSTYDLALAHGVKLEKAMDLAIDTVRLTQGRYGRENAPAFMNNRALRFTLVFKKYAQLQYQLLGDMTRRAFTDASQAERKVAFHQLKHLMLTNALIGGILVVPGMEAFKGMAMVLNQLGLTDSLDELEHDFREMMMKKAVGKDMEQIIDKGALSVATGIDLGSRVGWQDLITGFPPKDNSTDERLKFLASFLIGSPGGALSEGVQAAQAIGKMAQAVADGKPEEAKKQLAKALALASPVKVFGDTAKAIGGYSAGKLSGVDAAKQVIGFRSLKQAEAGDEVGASIRASKAKKDEVNTLISNYISAIDPADVAEAKKAIQAYNRRVPKGQRPISLSAGLEKKRLDNAAMYE